MYMKSLVSLAVLGAMSTVATAGDHVVFDKPNESHHPSGENSKMLKMTLLAIGLSLCRCFHSRV